MSFKPMMELLQTKNKGKIVIENNGNFYIAVGKDAVALNDLLDLKVTCFSPEVCKAGFPIASLEKYVDKLQNKKYSYIVYYFDKDKAELEVLLDYNGNKARLNCYIFKHSTKYYKKEDVYVKAVAKLFEKEKEVTNNDTKQIQRKRK